MKLRHVEWPRAHRIIATRFPPIHLFERLSTDPADWEAISVIEGLVNPRLRQEIGDISLVPPEDRVGGNGASCVMAPFTHLNPKGSRFSDGTFGVYYAGKDFETALRETVFHYEEFYADADLGISRIEDMRVLVGVIGNDFHDIQSVSETDMRALGQSLRDQGSNGVVYPSVRDPGGSCIGAFRPKAVGIPVQTNHLAYHWNGHRITRVFDYLAQIWREL